MATATRQASFDPELFSFLADLRAHNDRDWFAANRQRYEEHLLEPALAFIDAFAPRLEKISPHFRADARPSGGSLFRIHSDTRFSKDKSPYKTNVGIHFRHELAKDAHAPGYYLHIGPAEVFAGGGIWHPDTRSATRIREAIVAEPERWGRVTRAGAFRKAARARRRLAQARPVLGGSGAPVRRRPATEGLLRLGDSERGRRRRSGFRRRVRPHLPHGGAADAIPLRRARRPVLTPPDPSSRGRTARISERWPWAMQTTVSAPP